MCLEAPGTHALRPHCWGRSPVRFRPWPTRPRRPPELHRQSTSWIQSIRSRLLSLLLAFPYRRGSIRGLVLSVRNIPAFLRVPFLAATGFAERRSQTCEWHSSPVPPAPMRMSLIPYLHVRVPVTPAHMSVDSTPSNRSLRCYHQILPRPQFRESVPEGMFLHSSND